MNFQSINENYTYTIKDYIGDIMLMESPVMSGISFIIVSALVLILLFKVQTRSIIIAVLSLLLVSFLFSFYHLKQNHIDHWEEYSFSNYLHTLNSKKTTEFSFKALQESKPNTQELYMPGAMNVNDVYLEVLEPESIQGSFEVVINHDPTIKEPQLIYKKLARDIGNKKKGIYNPVIIIPK